MFEDRRFEAVKYTIALTKLLSYFLKKIVQEEIKQTKELQEEIQRPCHKVNISLRYMYRKIRKIESLLQADWVREKA